jgi:hypothetical protein
MPRSEPNTVAETMVRTAAELLGTLAHQLDDILPAEARLHLIRAQRELLLAAVAVLEHHQEKSPAEPERRRVRKISLD